MKSNKFDWRSLDTAYGRAESVPESISDASNEKNDIDAFDIAIDSTKFIFDNGFLNSATGPFVDLVIEYAHKRKSKGMRPWPIIRSLLPLISSRALYGDTVGFAPSEGPPILACPWGQPKRLIREDEQKLQQLNLVKHLRKWTPFLIDCVHSGSSEDRANAAVICVAGHISHEGIFNAFETALSQEKNPRTRASLLLAWALSRPSDDRLKMVIFSDLKKPDQARFGAAIAWSHCPNLYSQHVSDKIVSVLSETVMSQDSIPTNNRFDYAWHNERISGEASRAIYMLAIPKSKKIQILSAVLSIETDDSSLIPEITPATSAAWFIMRAGLSRHYHRNSILDPEELTQEEREVVLLLNSKPSWLFGGGGFPERFGIADFISTASRLTNSTNDALSVFVESTWGFQHVRWSKWKWLRASQDHTSFESLERTAAEKKAANVVVSTSSFKEIIEIINYISETSFFPVEKLLIAIGDRAIMGEYISSTFYDNSLDISIHDSRIRSWWIATMEVCFNPISSLDIESEKWRNADMPTDLQTTLSDVVKSRCFP